MLSHKPEKTRLATRESDNTLKCTKTKMLHKNFMEHFHFKEQVIIGADDHHRR